MYFKVAAERDIEAPDIGLPPALPDNEVWDTEAEHALAIVNIQSFIRADSLVASGLSAMVEATSMDEESLIQAIDSGAGFGAASVSRGGGAGARVSSITPHESEDALFAGLAELTKGRYIVIDQGDALPILGDITGDGTVDALDRQAVYTWFGRPVDYYNQGSVNADIDKNGFIDNNDMAYIRYRWTDFGMYAPIVGDTDYNWCVDQSDLNKIWQWFGRTPGSGDQEFYHADLNADGVVDYDDVLLYWEHAGEGCGTNGIPTCNDGIQYGEETDIDCGGSVCVGCGDGQACIVDDDCLSNVCENGLCVGDGGSGGDVEAGITVYHDWGAGYCANVSVSNNADEPTTSWTVNMNMRGGTIMSSWSGVFTGNVTVGNVNWNAVIGANQTIASAGFCANRDGGGTAEVVSASATY